MSNWAADLYAFLAGRRLILVLPVLAVMFLALWQTLHLKLDQSLQALWPEASAQGLEADLLDLAPFSKLMLIQLTAEKAESRHLLAGAADELAAGLDPQLFQVLDLGAQALDPAALMALLPALCADDCRAELRAEIEAGTAARKLMQLKDDLAGPAGLNDFFWRADPFNWRAEVFRHFPRLQGWPLVDPLVGYPLSQDGRHLLLIVEPLLSMNDTAGSIEAMDNIEKQVQTLPAGLSAQVVGAHRHTAANARAIEGDLALTLSLAFLLILAIYVFLVRSLGAFWLFLTPAVAVLLATAALTLVFPKVSGLALGFGAAVLGIAEDYAVHVHFALRKARQKTGALRHVARPLLMSAILCAAGFGVLLFSSIPAIRQLAFFSGAAIVVGYLWAIVVLPHCPAMDRPREYAERTEKKGNDPEAIGLKKGPAALVFTALAGLCLILLALTPFNASIREMGLAKSDLRKDQESVEANWRMDGGRKVFLAEGRDQEEALKLAAEVETALRAASPAAASSLAGLIPPREIQQTNLAGWRDFQAAWGGKISAALAESEALGYSAEAFRPFYGWFSAEPEPISPARLSSAGLGLMAEGFLAEKNGRHYALVLAEGGSPDLPAEYAGRVFQLSAAAIEKSLSLTLGGEKSLLPFCVLICLAILVYAFKSLRLALLAFIPALGGLAAVLLTQLVLGRPLGLVEAAALPLVICLSADYGIVVVSELREEADLGAPKAIFVSGLSTIAGIGILILADHPVLHGLGRTVFVGLLAAMPISILLLPKIK